MSTRRGFTLIELMVASLLMAMLVTILTMIFNQSSIAWTTGVASVRGLGDSREKMALIGLVSENLLESLGARSGLPVVTLWDPDGKAQLRTDTSGRGVDLNGFAKVSGAPQLEDPMPGDAFVTVNGAGGNSRDAYIVGVTSYGPDGKTGGDYSWDDITTMPEDE